MTDSSNPQSSDDRPPIGRSWLTLYCAVLINLLLLILLFYLFTRTFS